MKGKDLSKKARDLGLTEREELFCYKLIENGGQKEAAAKEAGFKPRSAGVSASKALKKPRVQEFLALIRGEVADESVASAKEVLERLTRIARANPNELISHVVHCCRHCWGKEHLYQWTPEEFRSADLDYRRKRLAYEGKGENEIISKIGYEPDPSGGLDYDPKKKPNPDCPECAGLGETRVQALDSRALSPEALELFAGAKQTQHGLEIQMHSKEKALDSLAKHHNLFKDHEKAGSGEIHVHLSEQDMNL